MNPRTPVIIATMVASGLLGWGVAALITSDPEPTPIRLVCSDGTEHVVSLDDTITVDHVCGRWT